MEQEYKYTFNNLKRELREFTTQQLNKKLEEQQKELMKRTIELSSGSSTRVTYTRETKFNLKKIHRIIATIKTVVEREEAVMIEAPAIQLDFFQKMLLLILLVFGRSNHVKHT